MASRKRRKRQKVTRHKVASDARRNNKTRTAKVSISSYGPSRKKAYNPARHNPSPSRAKLLQVAGDIKRAEARGEKLTFTQACENRNVAPRSRHNHVTKLFYKDSSGRIHARKSDRYTQRFSVPTTRPDVFDSITARGNDERSLVGRWLN